MSGRTPERDAYVIRKWSDRSLSRGRLAESLGVSRDALMHWAIDLGLRQMTTSERLAPEVAALWPTMTPHKISEHLGCTYETVRKIAKTLSLGTPAGRPHSDQWPPERDGRLRAFWAQGLTVIEIGLRLGLTKNAVVGRVHRLGLPGRQSPIKSRLTDAERLQRRELKRERDALRKRDSSVRRERAVTPAPIAAVSADLRRSQNTGLLIGHTLPLAPEPLPGVTFKERKSQPCCFVQGEPRGRHTRYCDASSLPGKSYCAEHQALCYVRAVPGSPQSQEQQRP